MLPSDGITPQPLLSGKGSCESSGACGASSGSLGFWGSICSRLIAASAIACGRSTRTSDGGFLHVVVYPHSWEQTPHMGVYPHSGEPTPNTGSTPILGSQPPILGVYPHSGEPTPDTGEPTPNTGSQPPCMALCAGMCVCVHECAGVRAYVCVCVHAEASDL